MAKKKYQDAVRCASCGQFDQIHPKVLIKHAKSLYYIYKMHALQAKLKTIHKACSVNKQATHTRESDVQTTFSTQTDSVSITIEDDPIEDDHTSPEKTHVMHLGSLLRLIGNISSFELMNLRLKLTILLQIDTCMSYESLARIQRSNIAFTGTSAISITLDGVAHRIESSKTHYCQNTDTVSILRSYMLRTQRMLPVSLDALFVSGQPNSHTRQYTSIAASTLRSCCETFLRTYDQPLDIPLRSLVHEYMVTGKLPTSNRTHHVPHFGNIDQYVMTIPRRGNAQFASVFDVLRYSMNA